MVPFSAPGRLKVRHDLAEDAQVQLAVVGVLRQAGPFGQLSPEPPQRGGVPAGGAEAKRPEGAGRVQAAHRLDLVEQAGVAEQGARAAACHAHQQVGGHGGAKLEHRRQRPRQPEPNRALTAVRAGAEQRGVAAEYPPHLGGAEGLQAGEHLALDGARPQFGRVSLPPRSSHLTTWLRQ